MNDYYVIAVSVGLLCVAIGMNVFRIYRIEKQLEKKGLWGGSENE